jgi:hypothetical protein
VERKRRPRSVEEEHGGDVVVAGGGAPSPGSSRGTLSQISRRQHDAAARAEVDGGAR